MTAGPAGASRAMVWQPPGWVLAAALICGSALAAGVVGGATRPLFIAGCGLVGLYAWRQGPAAHLICALLLFAFAPFVRRLVDLSAGFDPAGLMLTGPLLALLVCVPQLLFGRRKPVFIPLMLPLIVVAGCVVYAALLSMLQGDFANAASGTLKWLAPLLYAGAILEEADRDEMLDAAASTFAVILPIIGAYGIFQYVNPPDWDRYWMQYASIMSAGEPIPYGVRTFSTLNGPASFATFTALGLLIVWFARSRWQYLLLTCPAGIGLLLSLYRTAWISLAVGVAFCLAFTATRRLAVAILIGAVVLVVAAATLTPFGDVIGERLVTLGEGSQDGSAQERIDEFVTLWNQWDSSVFGTGFTFTDVGTAGAMPIDGMIIACWLTMGIVVGLVCLGALVAAAMNMIITAWRDGNPHAIIIGALGCGALSQLPLANLTSGESGFMFWTFAVLLVDRKSAVRT
ncbi:MAG: O-antigen ligase family protein [Xanthobacteraceae bacterium]|nr:O-antigen ligase family protein [Xanthobacteraceae bacterium]